MKIVKASNHKKECWRVDLGVNDAGRRIRKFFPTRCDAENFASAHKEAVRKLGTDWACRFDAMSIHQKADIMLQMDRAERLGLSFRKLLDDAETSRRTGPSVPLGTVLADFLEAKQARGMRHRSFRKLKSSLEMFAVQTVRERPIRNVSSVDIRDFLHRNGWAPATVKSYLGDVRTFFAWAVKRRYISENPAELVEVPMLEDKPPGILTVEQIKHLLDVCQRFSPTLLAWVSLALFAGVRSEEARRLEWVDIQENGFEVKGIKAKTRRRRWVELSPQLKAWLEAARFAGSDLPPKNCVYRWSEVRRQAGLKAKWPHNALRHSFASYHFGKHGNEAKLAEIMGTSPQMLFANYRALVRPEEAEAFFNLRPDMDAIAVGIDLERKRRSDVKANRGRHHRKPRSGQSAMPLEKPPSAPEGVGASSSLLAAV